ncbi:hypothetical protein D3C84_1120350 [compost metagenome]
MLIAQRWRLQFGAGLVQQVHALPRLDPADHRHVRPVGLDGCQLGGGQGKGQAVVVATGQRTIEREILGEEPLEGGRQR